MLTFLLSLAAIRVARDAPRKAGGKPKQKPPDLELDDANFYYATAFFREMYGA